jgi:hypothetical protein
MEVPILHTAHPSRAPFRRHLVIYHHSDMIRIKECGRWGDQLTPLSGKELERKLATARKRRMTAAERRAAGLSRSQSARHGTTVGLITEGAGRGRLSQASQVAYRDTSEVRRVTVASDYKFEGVPTPSAGYTCRTRVVIIGLFDG